MSSDPGSQRPPRAIGLFAGVGGLELGLASAGFATTLMCEIWAPAQAVLSAHFPEVALVSDVREIDALPAVELIAAGFPCQDLSQAGRTAGIGGRNSGLVSEVFRLLDGHQPTWLVLENVPFMLQLDQGAAMRYLVDELSSRGYTWAYRVVDSRSFGLPQRRKRVVLVASQTADPCAVLFADEAGEPPDPDYRDVACGFYWTEGVRGLGWAPDAIPTLKGGSTIGIPSPPAILLSHNRGVVLPDLRDAERLQGFEADWTRPAEYFGKRGVRWKLIGNAVSVPVAAWLGRRLREPGAVSTVDGPEVGRSWPRAAWGREGSTAVVEVSEFPLVLPRPHLEDFLRFPTRPLSERATAGFLSRTSRSSLRFREGFLEAVAAHLEHVREQVAA